jgi:hypothetical protein
LPGLRGGDRRRLREGRRLLGARGQGGGGLLSVFLSNRPGADPLTADGTAGQIAAEIRRRPSGAPPPDPEALMRAGAFLQLVHEADRQRCEVSAALQCCERVHAELLDALAGEDARPHPDSIALADGFQTPERDSLLEQRVRAWARLFVHRPYPGPVFVTSSPEVVGLLADKFPALRRIGRSAIVPAALAALFQGVKRINALVAEGRMDARGAGRLLALLRDLDAVMAIFDFSAAGDVPAGTRELIDARERARAERNWVLADRLRHELLARGICVQDHKL